MPLPRVQAAWASRPGLHYAAVYAIPMVFCFIDRLVALSAILDMTATASERDAGRKIGGLALGVVQDALLTTLLVAVLLVVELVRQVASSVLHAKTTSARTLRVLCLLGHALRVAVVLLSIVAALAFVAADLLLVRTRSIRFTTDLIVTYWRERSQASSLEVDPREKQLAVETVVATAVVSIFFTVLYVAHVDLLWRRRTAEAASPTRDAFKPLDTATPGTEAKLTATLSFKCLEEGGHAAASGSPMVPQGNALGNADASELESQKRSITAEPSMARRLFHSKKLRLTIVAIIAYVLVIAVTRAIATEASPVVAAIALNASLNELLRNVFHVQCLPGSGSDGFESAAYYLHAETESYELFQKDVLFRKTTGFKGPLAFDVQVEEKNPPNVMVLAVESFRYLDSLLMAANTSAGRLMQKNNLTVTPHFDHWASRGIAFNNMWSSWQTSRSLEAILFGQIAYDSVTDSGTTRGRKDTKLVGMPQLFKQKGYETVFTTGCIVTYDQWDAFLPSHGFETVIAAPDMKLIAEKRYNISKRDWDGPAHRGFNWGVHDDLSFDILGDLMVQKVKDQAERMKRGERKKPFFLNHYTISSHHTFDAHPTWLDSEDLPDFSPLCEGFENECVLIQKYAKLRYFTDMELGKFLDRMKAAGVLDDTIVVIVGDHGQSPEMGLANPIVYQTAVTHVASALVAEGRLGEAVGMVFEDATHHYDLLNTLADIVGVPKEGFLQTGVGRSLKRKIPFGERLVWSNNPMKKMAVVQGHQRFVYDRSSNDMGLYDTVKDSQEEHDLLPSLPLADATKLQTWRRKGRELNAYFKHRWDEKCLASVAC